MNDRKFLDYVTSTIENQKPSGATYVVTQLAISLCRKDILPYSSLFNYIEDRSSFFSKAAASIRKRNITAEDYVDEWFEQHDTEDKKSSVDHIILEMLDDDNEDCRDMIIWQILNWIS